MNPISAQVNCVSYNDQDGCTYDDYTFEIDPNTGSIVIHHEIRCGLMGTQLFCEPAIEKEFGFPIPHHMVSMIQMMIVNDDFKTEPRHRSAAIDQFIQWLLASMEQLATEHKAHTDLVQRLTEEKELAEQEVEAQYHEHKTWMDTSIGLMESFLQR
jgi:hypothetical protein